MQEKKEEYNLEEQEMKRLDGLANVLDNSFRIPGTKFRFGIDAIIGLIPYVGDVTGFAVSGYLLTVMVRKGAGIGIMIQMMGNMLLDAMVGIIPFFGDIFDFGYKANRRNVDLLKRYYADGKVKPNAKISLSVLTGIFLVFFFLLIVGIWKTSAYFIGLAWAAFS